MSDTGRNMMLPFVNIEDSFSNILNKDERKWSRERDIIG
jgi:hypothetical protein